MLGLLDIFFPEKPYQKANRILRALSEWQTDTVEERLELGGLDVLGAGAYGVVIDNGDTVVKYVRANDQGYRAFLDICIAHPSPYFPVVFWTEMVNNEILAVCLEKLDDFEQFMFDDGSDPLALEYETLEELIEDRLVPANAELAEAAALLNMTSRNMRDIAKVFLGQDLCWNNVMLRGNQLVITDPWC